MANRRATRNEVPIQPGIGAPGPFFVHIENDDIVEDQSKVTTGLFTGNVGTLVGSNFVTESATATQKKYYYNLQYSNTTQLSVAFGHLAGSGSIGSNGNLNVGQYSLKGETEAVYRQFANHVMDDDLVNDGFVFNSGSDGAIKQKVSGSSIPDGKKPEHGMYFIQAKRSRMKDRVNSGTWTIQLSGSTSYKHSGSHGHYTNRSSSLIHLTDDSKYTDGGAHSTPAGPRYNVISGSGGIRQSKTPVYGWFYPNLGLWALRESMLSSSIPGQSAYVTGSSTHGLAMGTDTNATALSQSGGNGLAMDTTIGGKVNTNAIKLVKALQLGTQTMRAEEDQTTTAYFCRARAHQFNATNNPTFLSGSSGRLTNLEMEGNPQTFVTTIGLYDSGHKLVAVGRLTSPISKNFSKEVTLKVKLTF